MHEDDTIMMLLKLNQEERKRAGTSQSIIPPSATHLLPRGATYFLCVCVCVYMHVCVLSWTRLSRNRAKLTQSWTQTHTMDHIFPLRTFPTPPSSSPLDVIQAFSRKSKKICFSPANLLFTREVLFCCFFFISLKKGQKIKNTNKKSSLEESHNCAAID